MDSEEIDKWDLESERAWKNDNHILEFPEPIVKLLTEILSPEAKILDCGCGIGKHLRAFKKLGYDAMGIDQSAKAVEYAMQLNPDTKVLHIRIQDMTYNSEFSLIHTCAVLQHSKHERKQVILKLFQRALKPFGYLLCTECTFPEGKESDGYSFTEKGWIEFMWQNGFEHIKTIPPWPYYLYRVRK
jgi:2-polyprenyl-3-methyl-5-hydroxy-6-metoxy-1,4-benzoquinol methylase